MLLLAQHGLMASGGAAAGGSGAPDFTNPINDNLALFVGSHPPGSELGSELISGQPFSTIGDADFTTRDHPDIAGWKSFDCRSATTAGAVVSSNYPELRATATTFTWWADITIDSDVDFAHVFVATSEAGWASPFGHFMGRQAGNDVRRDNWKIGGARERFQGATGSMPTTGRMRLWTIRNGASVIYGVDAVQVGSAGTIPSGALDWTTATNDFLIFNRHADSLGEGIDGAFHCLRWWTDAKDVSDMADLNTNPQLGLFT